MSATTGDGIHVRVCCKDWERLRSTVRMPMESNGEQEDATLGCVVDFPALMPGQWAFLQPELDRAAILYDYIDHAVGEPRWVRQLTTCR